MSKFKKLPLMMLGGGASFFAVTFIIYFFHLDLKQGLKYITLPDAVSGVFCFVLICAAAAVGLF